MLLVVVFVGSVWEKWLASGTASNGAGEWHFHISAFQRL